MKSNLYVLTLEPIEQRYTKQWYEYFKPAFSKYFNVIYIDGPSFDDKIEKGRFLDINKTNIWKAKQVELISRMFYHNKVEDGDRFFFADGWDFGITALKYMSQLNNIKTKIYAFWHAGSWDQWDFISQAGLGKWAFGNELGWLKACDCNFVATMFHKKLITDYFLGQKLKIEVSGFPMNWMKEINKRMNKNILNIKRNLIVFPHRLDKEKAPEVFDKLAKKMPEYEFVKTIEVTKNKKEYYELLRHAKVVFSASLQETFGIGAVEGMMLGAIPVVPNRLSYPELYSTRFIYADLEDAKSKIEFIMNHYDKSDCLKDALKENQLRIQNDSLSAIDKMAKVMLNG